MFQASGGYKSEDQDTCMTNDQESILQMKIMEGSQRKCPLGFRDNKFCNINKT